MNNVRPQGKFLQADQERFLIKGVTYGTFAPDQQGCLFPPADRIAADFAQMAALGINTVRTYTVPMPQLLDTAQAAGLRVLAGIPWTQHVAFLGHRRLRRSIRRQIVQDVASLKDHPALLMCAVGNEIPAGVVRWHGRHAIDAFLREIYLDAKSAAPDTLLTYANFPPTEFLELGFFDVCSFNVYLHRENDLRAYLARLQNVAGDKPLLLAEAGADSFREGEAGQAAITAAHLRVAFEAGACGAVAFAWTDEWWRGGHEVEDWAFGLVDRDRQPKPAAAAVAAAFRDAPFPAEAKRTWPRVSVVVCARNAADTIDECLASLAGLNYPDYEVLLVDDGSTDRTAEAGARHSHVRVIRTPHGGLSAARNTGLGAATGEIVAYTDADVRVDADWLMYLVQPFLTTDVVGTGGPNVVPADDPPMAQCVARAPGAPTHVLLDDTVAEHVPGCNMAFRRDALLAIDGFNPIYLRAGDDVDVCWRLQARGWRLAFAPAALVWHRHRSTVRAYWRQQAGYGEGEAWLEAHHPEKFLDGRARWHGRMYSPLPLVRSLSGTRVNSGIWGMAPFPSVYNTGARWWTHLPAAMFLAACVFAWRTNLDGVALTARGAAWHRLMIFWLHLVQPVARGWGRLRGQLSPPELAAADTADRVEGAVDRLTVARTLMLLVGRPVESRYWSSQSPALPELLDELLDTLRRSRAGGRVVVDDGWSEGVDFSVYIGRWARLEVSALLEDHGAGAGLFRVRQRLKPTAVFGAVGLRRLTHIVGALQSSLDRLSASRDLRIVDPSFLIDRRPSHTPERSAFPQVQQGRS